MCLNILRPAGQMRIVFVTGGQVMIKSRYWRRHFYSLITHNHQGLAITLASSLTLPIIVIVHKTVDKHLQPWHMSTVNCDPLQHSAVSRYRHNYPLSPSLSSPWQAQGFASQEFLIHLWGFTFPWCCHPRRGQAILGCWALALWRAAYASNKCQSWDSPLGRRKQIRITPA